MDEEVRRSTAAQRVEEMFFLSVMHLHPGIGKSEAPMSCHARHEQPLAGDLWGLF